MPEKNAILAKPEDFGFEFLTETVHKYGKGFVVPLLRVTNIPKFEEAFPGVIRKALDGSSIRVIGQRIVRDASADRGVKDTGQLQTLLVNYLLGIEEAPARYVAADGKAYATQEEAAKASVEWALAQ